MKEESLTKMSEMALSNGYMFKPINIYGPEDRQRIVNNVADLFKDQAMNDFVLYNIVDRLTYVRDYYVRKSLNFMMTVKDKKGETIAFAEMIYSKNSEMLYVKTFKVQEGHNEKEVLALSIKGAKDHLKDHGLKFNTILTSPKVSDNKENLNVMMDLGMKFMAFTPKTDYGILSNNKETQFSEKNEIVLFPFKEKIEEIKPSNVITKDKEIKTDKKKQDKLWEEKKKKLNVEKEMLDEMRILLVKKYGKEKMELTEDKFRKFLNDVKEEETELAYLFKLFKKDSDVKITIRKMDEIEKLLLLFKNWDEKHKKNDEPELRGSKKIDQGILELITNFNKKKV